MSNFFSNLSQKKPNFTWSIAIFIGFFVLAFVMTFPLILNFSDSFPATYGDDTRYFSWNIWQFRYTIFNLQENPFSWSKLLYYPIGFSQAATAYDNLYNTVLALPLYFLIQNDIVVYNLLLLFNVALAGVGMYLFVSRHFTRARPIALLIAFAFAFSPYSIHRLLGHINLATIQWIPFFLLYFIELLKRPNKKNAILSGLFLFLVGISSWHYLVYLSLIVIFLVIYKILFEKEKKINWRQYGFNFFIFCLSATILILPVAFPLLKASLTEGLIGPTTGELITFSADPLSYLTPSPLYLLGKGILDINGYCLFSDNVIESTTYLGLAEIILLVFFLFSRKKLKKEREWSGYKKWLWFIVIFFILSLGPYLKVIGHVLDTFPMPMYFLLKLPFVSLARDSVRLSLLVLIGVLVILSKFLDYLKRTKTKKTFNYLLIFLFFIFFLERLIIPFPLRKLNYPVFYDTLRQDKEQYAIIDIPVTGWIEQEYNFTQMIHQKFVASGAVQHTSYNKERESFIQNDPFLKQLVCWYPEQKYSPPVFNPPLKEKLKDKYLQNNFKYIFIHKDILNYPICRTAKTITQSYLKDVPRVYTDDKLEVISVGDL